MSNQRWLGEKLIEASTANTNATTEEIKLEKLNSLFGAWSGSEGERIEADVKEARNAGYEREQVSMDY